MDSVEYETKILAFYTTAIRFTRLSRLDVHRKRQEGTNASGLEGTGVLGVAGSGDGR